VQPLFGPDSLFVFILNSCKSFINEPPSTEDLYKFTSVSPMDDATRRQAAGLVAAWWVMNDQFDTQLDNDIAEEEREVEELLLLRARQRRQEQEEQERLEQEWLLLLAQRHRRGLLASLPAPSPA